MKVVCLALAAVLTLPVFAKESKWIGPATGGSFLDAENWDNGVPGSGDTAVFATEATVQSSTTAKIDIGDGGLTIKNSAAVTLGHRLKGKGTLVKKGAGDLTYKASNYDKDFLGGARIEEGRFVLVMKDVDPAKVSLSGKSTELFSSGTITVTGSGIFRVNGYKYSDTKYANVDSKIMVTNHIADVAIESNDNTTWNADIKGYCDFSFKRAYNPMTFGGTVTAPGKTVTMTAVTWDSPWCGWSAVFDCNLVIDANNKGTIQFQKRSPNPGNTMTVKTKTLQIAGGSAGWSGMVVIDGGKIATTGGANFGDTTALTIKNDGTLDAAYDLKVRRLNVDGEEKPDGVYSKSNVSRITNSGKVTVNSGVKLWTGAGDKVWSNAANWDGAVATTGDTVVFPFDTVFAKGEVDIGASGMTFDCRGNVSGPLKLTGTGLLVKKGPGQYSTGAFNTVSGGLRIEEGVAQATMKGEGFNTSKDAFGSGTIEITGKGAVYFSSYISTNTQAIVIHDHDGSVDPVQTSGSHVNLGTITSDADFTISTTWGTPVYLGAISAPGHTVTYSTTSWNTDKWPYDMPEFSDLDANLTLKLANNQSVRLTGAFERKTNAINVVQGGVQATVNQRWGAITLANKTTASVGKGVTLACESLTVAGVVKPNGVYRKTKLPGVLTGDGRLLVGDEPGFTVILR